MVIWVTGLSRAGKTTLCNALWKLLKPSIPELLSLDGDIIRSMFGNDLGYTQNDRVNQITRIQHLAKLLSDQGSVVLVAALYGNEQIWKWNRENISLYYEIYLEAALDSLKKRDDKGLYKGDIPNVVGLDIHWDPPKNPFMIIDTNKLEDSEILARRVIKAIPSLYERIRED